MKTYPADHPYAEKIARSRSNARKALVAYGATPYQDVSDPLRMLSDLIGDLMHLADEIGEDSNDIAPDETYGEWAARIAAEHGYWPEVRGEA